MHVAAASSQSAFYVINKKNGYHNTELTAVLGTSVTNVMCKKEKKKMKTPRIYYDSAA